MGKIFKGQTKLLIKLTVNQDISGANQLFIKYRKPSGTTGQWPAIVSNASTGEIYYEPVSSATLDEVGAWKIWSWVQFSDTREAAGETVNMDVYKEGQ